MNVSSVASLLIQAERPKDSPAVDALIDRVFGPGRLTKVSERVREVALFRPDLSFCAWRGEALVGVVRQWQVRVGDQPAIFLGPLAVDDAQRLGGLGGRLVEQACTAARAARFPAVVLVGDSPYFARSGFSAEPAAGIVLPGPVDQRRVLARVFAADVTLAGPLRA